MRVLLFISAIISLLVLTGPAQASYTFHFDYWENSTVTISGSGSFSISGKDGIYSLGNGLEDFSMAGRQEAAEFGGCPGCEGTHSASLADLSQFFIEVHPVIIGKFHVVGVRNLYFGTKTIPLPIISQGNDICSGCEGTAQLWFDEFTPSDLTLRFNPISRGAYPGVAYISQPVTGIVPEPTTWIMMFWGFGVLGISARYGRPDAKLKFK